MSRPLIGIIGGTGLGDALAREAGGEGVAVETPFGAPSGPIVVGRWEGADIAFLSRHGPGHRFNPSTVPYRANIWAMKKLGVSMIIASGATGSLREDVEPGHVVLCDQIIDRTFRRAGTFFDEGPVTHVEFADPFCPSLRGVLIDASAELPITAHHAGNYVCMEGPQFSTRAESQMHRQWGGDVIGMTCQPEARLAREAEICYALVALPTDYDCWRLVDPNRGEEALLKEIMGNLRRATDGALSLIRAAVRRVKGPMRGCPCGHALGHAVWSDAAGIDAAALRRLEPILARYLAARKGGAA